MPPERRFEALLLMALDSGRSGRPLCELNDTDLVFRRFPDLQLGDAAFDASTFSHPRRRLDDFDPTAGFFAAEAREAMAAGLRGDHSSLDGALVESFASAKSFRPVAPESPDPGAPPPGGEGSEPRNAGIDFHG